MSTKHQLKKFEKNLDLLRSITRAFEHTATKKMAVNKVEIEQIQRFLLEVKQTYINAKISVPFVNRAALNRPVRDFVKKKVAVLISSEPAYYGHLLSYMVDSFTSELEAHDTDAVIIGKPGKDEFDKKNTKGYRYIYFDFDDRKPDWRVVHDVSEILVNYSEINVIFAKFKSILTQDVINEDVAKEVLTAKPAQLKKYLIKPEPKSALTFLEKQIITSGFLQKLYENGLAKSAIRVRILEIGEIAEKLTEAMEKFEQYKRKVLRSLNNRKLANLYSSSSVWGSESIFTVYR